MNQDSKGFSLCLSDLSCKGLYIARIFQRSLSHLHTEKETPPSMIKTINLISLLLLHFYKESTMCGSSLTKLISFLFPGVLMQRVKPESRLKCQPQRGKNAFRNF